MATAASTTIVGSAGTRKRVCPYVAAEAIVTMSATPTVPEPGPAADDSGPRREVIDRALETLGQAVAAGFGDVAALQKDAALVPLLVTSNFNGVEWYAWLTIAGLLVKQALLAVAMWRVGGLPRFTARVRDLWRRLRRSMPGSCVATISV